MDQLETLVLPTETLQFNGQTFELRGLALPHITYIVKHHRTVLADLYVQATSGKLEGSIEEIAISMIDDFVPLASMVIACGMGSVSPKAIENAGMLPLSAQAEALEKILKLTLVGEGGLEKLMEIVVRTMAGAASLTSPKT